LTYGGEGCFLHDTPTAFAALENLYVGYLQSVNFAMKFSRMICNLLL